VTYPTPPYSAFGENFDNVPTAMVYDTFTETAAALSGRYMRLSAQPPPHRSGGRGGQRS